MIIIPVKNGAGHMSIDQLHPVQAKSIPVGFPSLPPSSPLNTHVHV